MLDAYAATHRAVANLKRNGELPERVRVRTSKYLNNTIEQDHRRVRQRLGPLLGLKSFRTAAIVISCIELAEKDRTAPRFMCKKGFPSKESGIVAQVSQDSGMEAVNSAGRSSHTKMSGSPIWIRTTIHGVKGRCPTIRRSGN